MFGSSISSARNTPKTPYCPVSKNRLRKWTAHMKAPPPMLAIISQPLWRKNDERWAEAVRGTVSALAKDMGLQTSKYVFRTSNLFRLSTFGIRIWFTQEISNISVAYPCPAQVNQSRSTHR